MPFQSAADSIVSYSPPYYNEAPGPGLGFLFVPTRPDPTRNPKRCSMLPEPEPNIIVCILFVLWL